MDEGQIWEQLDLRSKNVCRMLEYALQGGPNIDTDADEDDPESRRLWEALQALENEEMELKDQQGLLDNDSEEDDSDDWEDDDDYDDNEGEEEEEEESGLEDDIDLEEGVTSLRDSSSDEDEDGELHSDSGSENQNPTSQHNDHSMLDDDFFNLASFNAETEEAEAKSVSKGSLSRHLADEDSEEDDDMSVDIFAPVDDFEHFDEDDLENEHRGMIHVRSGPTCS
jgi:U3 small nucleolar RNA-associated protein MPP10